VGHLVQPPLPKQDHLQQAAQDLVQAGLEYLQRGKLYNLPGQPVPGLRHPQREAALPQVQTELPVPQFMPIAPCPVAGHQFLLQHQSCWATPSSSAARSGKTVADEGQVHR